MQEERKRSDWPPMLGMTRLEHHSGGEGSSMKDPRAFPEPRMWYFSPLRDNPHLTIDDCLTRLHEHTCALLNEKDARIAELEAGTWRHRRDSTHWGEGGQDD
jgi:hypothetical protein